jgi:hypothetical protein
MWLAAELADGLVAHPGVDLNGVRALGVDGGQGEPHYTCSARRSSRLHVPAR